MQDAHHKVDHSSGFGTSSDDTSSIMAMLQNMKMKQDERHAEDCKWRENFRATQMEQFRLMQKHMSAKDSNFETFDTYATESLLSIQNDVNANHVASMNMINYMIANQEANAAHYDRFYREICEVSTMEGRPRPRGRGRR